MDMPFPIDALNFEELKIQVQELIRVLYEEEIEGVTAFDEIAYGWRSTDDPRYLDGATIYPGTISMSFTGDLDDIDDGTTYGRVLLTDISAGHIRLSETIGDLDDIDDGTTWGKVALTDISGGHIVLAECVGDSDDIAEGLSNFYAGVSGADFVKAIDTLDEVEDGSTYGRVALTDISSGHIVLAECVGDLDDIDNGSTYGRVALTSISAGKIIVAGLDSGVTDRIFADGTTKTNIEAWRHGSDVTKIDGGDIYADSLTVGAISANSILTGKLAFKNSANLLPDIYSVFEHYHDGEDIGASITNGTAKCDSSLFYSGSRSLNMIASSAGNYTVLSTSGTAYNIPMKPSTKYLISAFCIAGSGTPDFRFNLKQDDGTTKYPALQALSTAWDRYTFAATTDGSLTDSGLIIAYNADNGADVNIDNIMVEEVDAGNTEPSAFGQGVSSANSVTQTKLYEVEAGDYVLGYCNMYNAQASATAVGEYTATPAKAFEIIASLDGEYRVFFNLSYVSGTGPISGNAQLYKNDVAISGTDESQSGAGYVTYSHDISGIKAGDLISVYIWSLDTDVNSYARTTLLGLKVNKPLQVIEV